MSAMIGVDSGGTFTDTVVSLPAGRCVVGKALSTPDRVEVGVLDSLTSAARSAGLTLRELLAQTAVISHGTTVGLNALLTRNGGRVGLLTTAGFESTLAMAKANKIHGLDRDEATQPVLWRKPDPLLNRRDIAGIAERIDRYGHVVTELDESSARQGVERLLAAGVEAFAVGFLWSTVNPSHELRVRELVEEHAPGIPCSLSSLVAPVVGEYERFSTCVIDASISNVVSSYLRRLDDRLREQGFTGNLMVLRTGGGAEPVTHTLRVPVNSLRSGPVAGLVASAAIGSEMGYDKVVATDVGGTSFDIGLVVGSEPERAGRPTVDRHPLAVPALEVVSIGTGGGSIAWLDTDLGALRVGPQSAGATPGPVCYARGGAQPTLTDAAAVLGYVSKLSSEIQLDVGAARHAVDAHIATPLGLTVEEAAAGIVRVASDQMKDLIRRATIQRGFDPSVFALFAYGGAGPQYAAWFCEGLGLRDVIVPRFAAEFSAFGAATSAIVVSSERDVIPIELAASGSVMADVFDQLDAEVDAKLDGKGEELERAVKRAFRRRRTVSLRFLRQQRRIEVTVEVWDPSSLARVAESFRSRYEEVTGPGTADLTSTIELVAARVELSLEHHTKTPAFMPDDTGPPIEHREAWFDGISRSCPVYRWDALGRGQSVSGPAFVESEQSTLVLPPHSIAEIDAAAHLHLKLGTQHGR